jgi:preprotein translocase SecE subunit
MAEEASKARKPRIRKTAPTVREKAEAAQAKAGSNKPSKVKQAGRTIKKPFKLIRIPSNPVTRFLGKTGRGIKRVLTWITPTYFINSWREVRLVTWPGRKETWKLTLAVIIFAVIFGGLIAGVDKIIDSLFRSLVLK